MNVPKPPILTPEENEIIAKFRDKMDRFKTYTIKDGELVVSVDRMKDKLVELEGLMSEKYIKYDESLLFDDEPLSFDDEPLPFDDEPLPFDDLGGSKEFCFQSEDEKASNPYTRREQIPKKVYDKNDIMELLQCGNQKALNFLKLLFQMKYAIKVGKSYLIKVEDFDRFFEDFKGKEIMI